MAVASRRWNFTSLALVRAEPGEGRRVSGEGLHAGGHARQSGQRAIKERQYRYFSVGVVDAKPDAGSRQHGLSLSQGGNEARIEIVFRQALRRCRCHGPFVRSSFTVFTERNDKFGVRWMFQTSSNE